MRDEAQPSSCCVEIGSLGRVPNCHGDINANDAMRWKDTSRDFDTRYINAQFYCRTIFNCAFNDKPDHFKLFLFASVVGITLLEFPARSVFDQVRIETWFLRAIEYLINVARIFLHNNLLIN